MPGKKPGTKTSKLKKAPSAKAAPRPRRAPSRPDRARTSVASRKGAPATVTRKRRKTRRKPPPCAPALAALRAAPASTPSEWPRRASAAAAGTVARLVPAADRGRRRRRRHSEPGSLLAGPRNVKPYVAKRGEQYMSKQQLAHFQLILLNWKRDLMEEVDRTVSHMKDEAANFPDPNDRATQEEEFSLELRTRDRERKLIRKIDEALKRIEDGTYGYCLETGEEIGIKRLEARPVATLSIEAQERRERRERQYGDRDDRYR